MVQDLFVSICIPAYQRPELLKRLLDSILVQEYTRYEVVVTDDSPGTTVSDLIDSHPLKPAIRYFKNQQPMGTPENWNESIRKAGGDWIKLMHDDDWFADRDSLGCFVRSVRPGPDFYFSAFNNVHSDEKKAESMADRSFIKNLNRCPGILLAGNRIGPPSAVLFKKDPAILFDRRFRWVVDFDFYIHYLKAHPPAVYIEKALVNIGISETQVTQSSFGNPAVEIPERFMQWEKMDPSSLGNWRVYDSWWRFVRNFRLTGEGKIRSSGYSGPLPAFIFPMMQRQKKIPGTVLRNGFFSKLLMSANFIRMKTKGRTGIQ